MDMNSMKFAHDMKMPIQLIYSCVQLLEMEVSSNARAEGYLQMLMRSADQLKHMVQDVLEDKPKTGLRLRMQDVVAQARMISRQCALRGEEKDIFVHFETNAARFLMPTDGEKLQRILQNLTSNALRFTEKGGHIVVSVAVRGDAVDFMVTDDGCGISEADRAHIFDVGFTRGGSGYGLPIVREYARALGGDVRMESAPGRGSRFIVHLPVLNMEKEG
jgi:signal transduction histidine kinase